jgi:integrase
VNGTITKRQTKSASPSWGYYFRAGRDESGKWIQITKSGFGTRREAAEAMRRAMAEHNGKTAAAPVSTMTFADWMQKWLTEYAARTASPKTLQSMREQSLYLIRELGTTKLTALTPLQVETALHRIQDHGARPTSRHPDGRPLAPKTARHVAFLLLKCLRKAVGLQLIPSVPVSDDYRPPKVERKDPPSLDGSVIHRLLTAASGSRLHALILLAAATGMRRGELLALTWSDIDFASGIVIVSKSLEETDDGLRVKGTKSGKPRRFTVPTAALDALKEHRCRQDRDRALFGPDYDAKDLVFCKPHGDFLKPDKVSVRVTKFARRAGLAGIGLHSLRHAHASQLLSSGAPIPTVSKRLGHANANVTLSIYSHALEADEVAAAKIWNDAIGDVIQTDRRTPRQRGSIAS